MKVLITGIGGGGHGEQILKALLMSNLDLEVYGADMNPLCRGFVFVKKSFVVPPATAKGYLDEILKICKDHQIKALFHGSEPELKVFNENREAIERAGIFLPINSKRVIDICMDKFKTNEFLRKNGFDFPKSFEIKSIDDANKIDCFPIVLKPSVGGGGSANTMIAQSKEELFSFCSYLLKIYPSFIAQEYIGTPDEEYTACVLSSMEGDYINSIAVKRMILSSLGNRMKVKNTTGKRELGDILAISSGISQGEIGRYPIVTDQCKKIAEALGSKGPINIQLRLVKNKVYVFEINPRYSGTTSLRAMVGFNEPELMIRKDLLGEEIKSDFDYKSGVILRGLDEHFIESDS
jgi:carbamoyl-phosphate synthase large subunit